MSKCIRTSKDNKLQFYLCKQIQEAMEAEQIDDRKEHAAHLLEKHLQIKLKTTDSETKDKSIFTAIRSLEQMDPYAVTCLYWNFVTTGSPATSWCLLHNLMSVEEASQRTQTPEISADSLREDLKPARQILDSCLNRNKI